jgi:hypothetical protein
MHQLLIGLLKRDGGVVVVLFYLFCLYFILFISVDFYNTHPVLEGLHLGVGDLAILCVFILY